MDYESLLVRRIMREHGLEPEELRAHVTEMLAVCRRALADAGAGGLSLDARFALAYSAAREAAEAMMLAAGYRPGGAGGNHAAVFEFLAVVADGQWAADASRFHVARRKRNLLAYRRAGIATEIDVAELTEAAADFLNRVAAWLSSQHPEALSPPPTESE